MVTVLTYEVIARHVFNAPTIWAHEMMMMVGCFTGATAVAYTLKVGGHLRIDLIYGKLSPNRGQPITDILGYIFLFTPTMVLVVGGGVVALLFAFQIDEVWTRSFWYFPTWPIKVVFLLGFCWLVFQGIAEFIKALYALRRKPL